MRVAVLGGTGFIGRHVAREFAKSGTQVMTIQRGSALTPNPEVASLEADRTDPVGLARALAIAVPAIVVDMIAYREEHAHGLLAALPSSVERLVVISSGDVYASYGAFLGLNPAPAHASPSREHAPLRTELFPYRRQAQGAADLLHAYEKILVERAANAWRGGATTILRLPMVYGPNDKQRRVAAIIARLRSSAGRVHVNAAEGAWRCTRGYVEDVAAAIRLAALSLDAASSVFNVGERDALSEIAWMRAIASAAGWHGDVVSDPTVPPTLEANWSADVTVDTALIRETLGYEEPVGREEGLRRTLATLGSGTMPR